MVSFNLGSRIWHLFWNLLLAILITIFLRTGGNSWTIRLWLSVLSRAILLNIVGIILFLSLPMLICIHFGGSEWALILTCSAMLPFVGFCSCINSFFINEEYLENSRRWRVKRVLNNMGFRNYSYHSNYIPNNFNPDYPILLERDFKYLAEDGYGSMVIPENKLEKDQPSDEGKAQFNFKRLKYFFECCFESLASSQKTTKTFGLKVSINRIYGGQELLEFFNEKGIKFKISDNNDSNFLVVHIH